MIFSIIKHNNDKRNHHMKLNSLVTTNALLAVTASALSAEIGQPLNQVKVSNRGEIRLTSNERIQYCDWHSDEKLGNKIRCVQVMAGTITAKNMNEHFTEKLKQARAEGRLPDQFYQSTTIVDMKQCLFGTGGIVSKTLEQHKRDIPEACFVNDQEGHATKAWGLKEPSSVFAINEKGKVFYAKDGKLSDQESDYLLEQLIDQTKRLSND